MDQLSCLDRDERHAHTQRKVERAQMQDISLVPADPAGISLVILV